MVINSKHGVLFNFVAISTNHVCSGIIPLFVMITKANRILNINKYFIVNILDTSNTADAVDWMMKYFIVFSLLDWLYLLLKNKIQQNAMLLNSNIVHIRNQDSERNPIVTEIMVNAMLVDIRAIIEHT